jgi:hypothetical protein
MVYTPPKRYPEFRNLLKSDSHPKELAAIIRFVEERKFSPEGAAAIIEAFGFAIDFATEGDPNSKVKNFTVNFEDLTKDFLEACEKLWEINWRYQPLSIRGNPHLVSKDKKLRTEGRKSRFSIKIILQAMNVPDKYKVEAPDEALAKTGS